MEKKTKRLIFLIGIWAMVGSMGIVYYEFILAKPEIEKEQAAIAKQAQEQQNLTPDQAAKGISKFLNTTANNMKNPPAVIVGGK